MRVAATALVALVVAAIARNAHADTPTAEDLYAQGQTAYDHKDWQTAVERWTASYDLSGETGLLFNVAQAERQAGDCAKAIATYRRYVETDADTASEQHKLAEGFVRELGGTCKSTALPTIPKHDPQGELPPRLNLASGLHDTNDRSVRSGRSFKIAGVVTGGAGVALLATGLVFGHSAQSTASEVTDACHTSCDWAQWKDKDASGRRDATIGRVLDGVGAAAIVGGLALYYVGVRQGETVVVAPAGREGAIVSWAGAG